MLSRQGAAEAQWESYRAEMHTLYLAHNKSLKDVMSYMKEKYSFDATWVLKELR